MRDLRFRIVIVSAALLLAAAVSALAVQLSSEVRCASARRTVEQFVAEWPADPQPSDLDAGITRLKTALDTCRVPDGAYYLALLYRAKGDEVRATLYIGIARDYGSEALKSGRALGGSARAAAAAPPADLGGISPYVRRRLALVVGISQFTDPGVSPLKYTAKDARAVAETLRTVGGFDDVRELIDSQATTVNIKNEVDDIARQAGPEDLVVVYLSSHGSPQDFDTAGISYVVTHDTVLRALYATAYKMTDLLEDITERIPAQRVVAFLDTCFSAGTFKKVPDGWTTTSRGLTFEGGPAVSTIAKSLQQSTSRSLASEAAIEGRMSQGVGRVVISSSGAAEKSWEDDKIQHGYFTYYLLEALRKPGPPPSIDDIFAHLKTRVPDAVRRDKGQRQTPTMVASAPKVSLFIRETPTGAPPARK